MPVLNITIDASGAVRGAKAAKRALNSVRESASSLSSKFTGMFSPLTSGLAALGGIGATVGLARIGDEFTNLNAQLVDFTGNQDDAESAQEALFQMSQRTGTGIAGNALALTRLNLASGQTNLSVEENVKVLGGLNSIMRRTGTSGQEASTSMVQLGQALASGKLQGDEFRSLMENAPGVMKGLADSIGVPIGELKRMSSESKLTSQVLSEAFLEMANNEGLKELPKTFEASWNRVVNAFKNAFDVINDENGIMAMITDSLDSVAVWIEANQYRFSDWITELIAKFHESYGSVNEWASGIMNSLGAAWPSISGFFSNVFYLLDKLVGLLKLAAEGWTILASNFGAARGALDAGNQLRFALDRGYSREDLNSLGDELTASQVSSGSRPAPEADLKKGGTVVNNNFNGQVTRSDVVNITREQLRQGARQ